MNRFRGYSIELTLVLVLFGAVAYFGYLGYGLLTPSFAMEPFSGVQALEFAETQLSFGPRVAGSENSREMGEWLVDELRTYGWDVVIQPFSLQGEVTARNIVAISTEGSPGLPVGIVATHYDTRLVSDLDNDREQQSRATPGANAGASAVALMLELARTLDVVATGHSICLVFFDAEENGGLEGWSPAMGSAYFVQQLESDVESCTSPRFALYLDMVGADNQPLYARESSTEAIVQAIWSVADDLGYRAHFGNRPAEEQPDAHQRFLATNTAAASIGGYGYRARHTMDDDIEQLSTQSLERVGHVIKAWLERGAPY